MSAVAVFPVYVTPFGAALRRLRLLRGISQSRLAEHAGFDHSYVSRLEGGDRKPTYGAVVDLSAALGCEEAERDSLLVSAGFLPVDGLTFDADLLALNEALSSDELPEAWKAAMRDSVLALLAGCAAFRGRPRLAVVRSERMVE